MVRLASCLSSTRLIRKSSSRKIASWIVRLKSFHLAVIDRLLDVVKAVLNS